MPIYAASEDLILNLKTLFERIQAAGPGATRSVAASRLLIRLACTAPAAEIYINGRKHPVEIIYGPSPLRPDLDIQLSADALHHILLGQLSLRSAVSNGDVKLKGPVWKTNALEDVFRHGQAIYPGIIQIDKK